MLTVKIDFDRISLFPGKNKYYGNYNKNGKNDINNNIPYRKRFLAKIFFLFLSYGKPLNSYIIVNFRIETDISDGGIFVILCDDNTCKTVFEH